MCKPRRNHLVVDGKPIPWSQSHKAFRDHLQDKQWKNKTDATNIAHLKTLQAIQAEKEDTQLFSMDELEAALNKLGKQKAPGPDHNANELFMILDEHNKKFCCHTTTMYG